MAPENRRALHQAAGVVLLAGLVAVGGVLSKERPADAAQLRIRVGELRSQAAELAELDDQGIAGRISTRIARSHVEQLEKPFDATFSDLTELDPLAPLQAAQRDTLAVARELKLRIENFSARRAPASRSPADLRDALQRIEDRLRQPA